ncbi:hypothetical protein [Actinacidiphila soli]|uniref:hypothetical protein n=1 Tax=Actinacidiphila soli TaxID=2487275 RepID=UPI001F0B7E6D|nr:hypothetical protein [Actinacidiphila soli]
MYESWVIFGKNWHLSRGHQHRFEGTRQARGLQPCDPEQDLETAVRFHQRETVDNYLGLKAIAPDLPFLPLRAAGAAYRTRLTGSPAALRELIELAPRLPNDSYRGLLIDHACAGPALPAQLVAAAHRIQNS